MNMFDLNSFIVKAQIFSAVCANLVVLWLGAFLIANDNLDVIRNLIFSASSLRRI